MVNTFRMIAMALGVTLASSPLAADGDLLSAVRAKDTKRAEALLKTGADLTLRDDQGNTALHLAAQADDPALIDLLLGAGADLEAREDLLEATPLAVAVIGRKHRAVAALLKHHPDLSHGSSDGSLLFLAALHGDSAVLKMLAEAGLDLRERMRYSGTSNVTALMAAAGIGNVEAVRALLELGVDPNARDAYGDHSLNWAVYFGRFDVVPVLLESGRKVELDFVGYGTQTALDMALAKKHAPTIELLKERGAHRAAEL